MNKEIAIRASKEFRKELDATLQRMKDHRKLLQSEPWQEDPAEGNGEVIAQHTLSIRDLESAIMRQGMTLKAIGNPDPYPQSRNPDSPVVEKTADGLKL